MKTLGRLAPWCLGWTQSLADVMLPAAEAPVEMAMQSKPFAWSSTLRGSISKIMSLNLTAASVVKVAASHRARPVLVVPRSRPSCPCRGRHCIDLPLE